MMQAPVSPCRAIERAGTSDGSQRGGMGFGQRNGIFLFPAQQCIRAGNRPRGDGDIFCRLILATLSGYRGWQHRLPAFLPRRRPTCRKRARDGYRCFPCLVAENRAAVASAARLPARMLLAMVLTSSEAEAPLGESRIIEGDEGG
jgi:hypothetical protein